MASVRKAITARKTLIQETLARAMKNKLQHVPTSHTQGAEPRNCFIYDTSGLIILYDQHGNELLPHTASDVHLTTTAVVQELRAQHRHQLLTYLFEMEGREAISIIESSPSKRTEDMLAYGMKRGSPDGNRRLGDADKSLFSLSYFLSELQEGLPIIVAQDSDIPHTISGLRTQRIGFLTPEQFVNLHLPEYIEQKTYRGSL